MSEWQPIETAPKDGAEILVFNGPEPGMYTEPGQIGIASWSIQAMPGMRECWVAQDCCDGVTYYNPTHWMPLPTPPKQNQTA